MEGDTTASGRRRNLLATTRPNPSIDLSSAPASIADSQHHDETQHRRSRSPQRAIPEVPGFAPASSLHGTPGVQSITNFTSKNAADEFVNESFKGFDPSIKKLFAKEATDLYRKFDALQRCNESRLKLTERTRKLTSGDLPLGEKFPNVVPNPCAEMIFNTVEDTSFDFKIIAGEKCSTARQLAYII